MGGTGTHKNDHEPRHITKRVVKIALSLIISYQMTISSQTVILLSVAHK